METVKKAGKTIHAGNIALAVLALAGFFCVLASIEAMQRNYTLRSEVVAETHFKRQIELDIAELEYQRIWRTSKEYQELALKSKMNLIADGEKILDLPNVPDWIRKRSEAQILETENKANETPNWQLWTRFLLGI